MDLNRQRWLWSGGLLVLLAGMPVWAQQRQLPPTVLPGRPDEQGDQLRLGEWFESKAAGIALRAPAGASEIRKAGVPDMIVEFLNEKQGVVLRVSKMSLQEPRQLADTKDANGRKKIGLVNEMASGFKRENPAAVELRNEIAQVGGSDAGLLAYRFSLGTSRRMIQQALIRYSDSYYYQITMTSPAAKELRQGEVDPREKQAADLFQEVLDSVKLIDRTKIAEDQQQRLMHTREAAGGSQGAQGDEQGAGLGAVAAPDAGQYRYRLQLCCGGAGEGGWARRGADQRAFADHAGRGCAG